MERQWNSHTWYMAVAAATTHHSKHFQTNASPHIYISSKKMHKRTCRTDRFSPSYPVQQARTASSMGFMFW